MILIMTGIMSTHILLKQEQSFKHTCAACQACGAREAAETCLP